MKANELRIGNYLTNFLGEVFEATGVTIGNFYHNEFGSPEPIELTKEWLFKFEKTEFNAFWSNISQDTNGYFLWVSGFKIYVKYVHQLQNLYFALTNNELKRVDGFLNF